MNAASHNVKNNRVHSMGDTYISHYPENPRGVGSPIKDGRGRVVDHMVLVGFERMGAAVGYVLLRPSKSRSLSVKRVPSPATFVDGAGYADKCRAVRDALLAR